MTIEAFWRSIELDPKISAYHGLLKCLVQAKRFKDAVGICREAIAIDPLNPSFHIARATAYGQARPVGLGGRGIPPFGHVVSRRRHGATQVLADALMRIGRPSDAADAARRALMIDQSHMRAHIQLAFALMELGQLTDAAREFEYVLNLEPKNIRVITTLASVDLQRLNHDGAMKLLAKALELSNDSPRIASQMLMSHGYAPNIDETALFAEHREWGLRMASKKTRRSLQIDDNPDRA